MKRFVALDFLRGCAILGVLGFHILNAAYDADGALEAALEGPNIAFLILAILLVFLGSFFPLFIGLSGLVNIISIDKQWNKQIEGDNASNKNEVFSKILKGQIIRGSFIILMGYISETLLNSALLGVLIGEDDILGEMISPFFFTQILVMIGLGVIIVSTIYLMLRKNGKSKEKIQRIFGILTIVVVVLTPVLIELLNFLPGFWDRPVNGWETRSFGLNLLYIILAPLVVDFNPLFPNLASMFIGTIIGLELSDGKTNKKFFNRIVISTIPMTFLGIVFTLLDLGYGLGEFFSSTAGSILLLLITIYIIDLRGKGNKFAEKTKFFRRFGTMTLTLWCLQWFVVIPLTLVQWIVNAITGTDVAFIEGPFMEGGLNGWGLLATIGLIFGVYHLILWAWEKVGYVGSFEWITVKLMSSQRANAAARLKRALNEAESIVEEPQEFWGKGTIIGLILIWLLYAVIGTLLAVL